MRPLSLAQVYERQRVGFDHSGAEHRAEYGEAERKEVRVGEPPEAIVAGYGEGKQEADRIAEERADQRSPGISGDPRPQAREEKTRSTCHVRHDCRNLTKQAVVHRTNPTVDDADAPSLAGVLLSAGATLARDLGPFEQHDNLAREAGGIIDRNQHTAVGSELRD